MSEMEILRRGLNPLVLNLQKMELELTCPICLKLLNLPTFLPCNHVSCSTCAITSLNGYGCPLCKIPFRYQDLKPATQIEAVVNIHKNLSSTLTSILCKQDHQQHVDIIPDGKTPSRGSGSTETEKHNNSEEFDQNQIYNIIGSKLGFLQKCTNIETEKSKQDKEVSNKKQKGSCGSHLSEERTDLDCDSNNDPICTPIIKGSSKREGKVEENVARESKKQKITENSNAEKPPQEEQLSANISVECGFCHSLEVTEATGPILHYLDSSPVKNEKALLSKALHAHEKCIEWAPQAFFDGDRAMNLEPELVRAAKMKCVSCGLKGAALGCYSKICKRSFHFPCAVQNHDCRFDLDNFLMACPFHKTKKLPCDKPVSKKNKAKLSISPTLPTDDLVPYVTNKPNELWKSSYPSTRDWYICGSALDKNDKEILDQFENVTGITITNNWDPNVTHVIAATDERGACTRTLKFLMAILGGKWILSINWLKACIEAGQPVNEDPFEITCDVHGSFEGPRTGRLRVLQKAPKLFEGLAFYLSGNFMPFYKKHLEDLVFAAGGSLVEKNDLGSSSAFVVYSTEPPQGNNPTEVITKRRNEAEELGSVTGCRVVAHTWILDSIAACNLINV